MKKSSVNVAVNEFVLKEWGKIPRDEARTLAKWASSVKYQFRSMEKSDDLALENTLNEKKGTFIREQKSTGEIKYYIKVVNDKGKLSKLCLSMEVEAFLMESIPLVDQLFPESYKNTRVKALENG